LSYATTAPQISFKTLPPKARLGANDNAFIGGFRLWSAKKDTGTSIFDGEA
jgi:hypothetical protein